MRVGHEHVAAMTGGQLSGNVEQWSSQRHGHEFARHQLGDREFSFQYRRALGHVWLLRLDEPSGEIAHQVELGTHYIDRVELPDVVVRAQ